MSKGFDHASVFGLLKDSIRRLNMHGFSYKEITDSLNSSGPKYKWNENALKQFVHRDSLARNNDKYFELLEFIIDLYHSKNLNKDLFDSELDFNISKIIELIEENNRSRLLKKISYKFLTMRNNSIRIRIPEKYIMIRKGEKENKIFVIEISTHRSQGGYYFDMKIQGVIKRRYIIGDVSITLSNVYFMGLGFGVRDGDKINIFDEINPINEKTLVSYVSDEPIGLEIFTFPVASLSETVFPVSILGMDANGVPLHGRAIMINAVASEELCKHLIPRSYDAKEFQSDDRNSYIISMINQHKIKTCRYSA